MNSDMTFSWKMKQNNKLTVTMFSPENFKNREKPQKFTTNTNTPSSSSSMKSNTNSKNSFSSFNQQTNSGWEFHSEVPNPSKRQGTPPLKKLISAPGNLQKYSNPQSNNGFGNNLNQFYHNSNTIQKQQNIKQQQSLMSNHSTIQRTCSKRTYSDNPYPLLQTQASTPSMLSLVTPITRKNFQRNKRKTKTQRPFLKSTKKLPSTSDLFHNNNSTTRKTFVPPPLLSTNSESSIFNTTQTQLPSLHAMVSGSPSHSPIHSPIHSPMQSPMYSPQSSPYNSCNDSDQEMHDVERQTSKMSIQNLLGPGNTL